MEVRTIAKNLRVSSEKVKLVIDQIRRLSPQEAVRVLDFIPKKSAPLVKKVILSAISNAKNNFGLSQDSLSFKEIRVSKGVSFKRYRPISRGRAHPILRRTSHLTVILEGEPQSQPKQAGGNEHGAKS